MDRVNEEAVLVGVRGCVHVLKVMWMAWRRSNRYRYHRWHWYCNQVLLDLEQHGYRRARRRRSSRGSHPRLLTISVTGGLTFVSVMSKTCSPSLNRFQLILVLLVIWISDSATVLGYWSN